MVRNGAFDRATGLDSRIWTHKWDNENQRHRLRVLETVDCEGTRQPLFFPFPEPVHLLHVTSVFWV